MHYTLAASRRPRDAESVLQAKPRHWRDKLFTAVEEFTNEIRTAPRKLKVSLEAASRRPRDAESVLQAKPRHWRDKLFTAVEEFTNEIPHCSKKIKSFAQAFSKACRVEGRSPSWVLRAKPLTSLAP